jgi:hypothetical protein
MELTQKYVKSILDYNDGFLYWKVCKGRNVHIGDRAASLQKMDSGDRYVIRINYKSYYCSRIIFLWHKGFLPECVDHKDRYKLNDKINNLRAASKSQNCKNKSSLSGSTSKYLGVHFYKASKKWRAMIYISGKNKLLGTFLKEDEAALAYNEAAKIHFKEFANLNIIK